MIFAMTIYMTLLNFMRFIVFSFFILSTGCVSAQIDSSAKYPDAWWAVVPADQLASWEIPPQAAHRELGEVILSKRNELGQFSNLADVSFELDGQKYASIEGLWQSLKFPESADDERLKDQNIVWPALRAEVMLMSGFAAKKAGDLANANMKKLGIKWVTYQNKKIEYTGRDQNEHYQLILRASRAKILQNTSLRALLLKTGSLKLLPDHQQKADSPPAYRYFDIYMKLRAELQNSPEKY